MEIYLRPSFTRYHVMLERYIKKLQIEAEMMISMVNTYVIPAAMKEQAICATAIGGIKAWFHNPLTGQTKRLEQVSKAIEQLILKKSELATL